MSYRTHTCGQLRESNVGQTVTLAGWVNSYRDHGGVRFIDLRDREGTTQVVFHPEAGAAHELASKMRLEDVVQVTGTCIAREGGINKRFPPGTIEIKAVSSEILADAQTPPFTPDDAHKVGEETRLRYRYIDMRNAKLQNALKVRHRVAKLMRDHYDAHGFYEIETPFLCRSTPEGARDFLVPSRLQAGSFYALPQSPQLFKQICMVGGLDKYFQIARCFRDEDPRADRQAEFTQVDMEMSFVTQEDVMRVNEEIIRKTWKEILGIEVPPVPRMTYEDAMNNYGSDRPDLRFDIKLVDVGDLAAKTDFKVFRGTLDAAGSIKAICIPQGGVKLSRKDTDALTETAKQFGAGGLPLAKVEGGKLASGISKFIESIQGDLIARLGATDGDLILFGVDARKTIVHKVLGELRCRIAAQMGLIPEGQWKWLWVTDFPAFEWDVETKRFYATHHPFTSPKPEDLHKLDSSDHGVIESIKSNAYDLVLNGSELGGGSIRIHRSDVQSKIFRLLGITPEEAKMKFGFLLEALSFGAPPHGGMAFGLDRVVMHLVGTTNIRDVIPFPKTQNGADLMTEAPSPVEDSQLKDLHVRLQLPVKEVKAAPVA